MTAQGRHPRTMARSQARRRDLAQRTHYSNHLLAAGPVSRILSVPASRDATAIPLGRALLRGSSDLPEGLTHRAGTCPQPRPRTSSLFGLAPCGVCPARGITAAAVRSYRTFSPLPRRRCQSSSSEGALCLARDPGGPCDASRFLRRDNSRLARPPIAENSQRRRGGTFSVALSVRQV